MTYIQKSIVELSYLLENISATYDVNNSQDRSNFIDLVNSIIEINKHLNGAYSVEKKWMREEQEKAEIDNPF
jgi:hypothetical protein